MSDTLTFTTSNERLPAIIGSLVFLIPGVSAVIIGVLTWFGLSWIDNSANGLLLGTTGLIWAGVGTGIVSFRRWIQIDPAGRTVIRGTQTVFRHPAERISLESFADVIVHDQPIGDTRFYVVALGWILERRPSRYAHQDGLWLSTHETVEAARNDAARVVAATGMKLVDRTQGDAR